jgi:hypothetical protein
VKEQQFGEYDNPWSATVGLLLDYCIDNQRKSGNQSFFYILRHAGLVDEYIGDSSHSTRHWNDRNGPRITLGGNTGRAALAPPFRSTRYAQQPAISVNCENNILGVAECDHAGIVAESEREYP